MEQLKTMDYPFSRRSEKMPSSFVRDILKVAAQADIISFAGGLPDPDLFPLQEMEQSAGEVFKQHGKSLLQYSKSEGLPSLKEWICRYYQKAHQMEVKPEQLLITCGAQQALDLIGKVFLDPGDEVILEQPSFFGAVQAFLACEANVLSLPIEKDGMDLNALESLLQQHQPKLLYLIPNFQNPSGISISAAKRQQLAELARTYGFLIVEDDPYGPLRFEGEQLPPIRALYEGTLLCGSFSKIIAPGLRLGWILAEESMISKLLIMKQAADLHTNNLSQYLAEHFLRNFSFEDHLARIRKAYGHKSELMYRQLKEHLPVGCSIYKAEGGMFHWVELPQGLDAEKLLQFCQEQKVIFVPGKFFFMAGGGENTLRLNFTNCSDDNIRKGVAILARAVKSLYEGQRPYLMQNNPASKALFDGFNNQMLCNLK